MMMISAHTSAMWNVWLMMVFSCFPLVTEHGMEVSLVVGEALRIVLSISPFVYGL
jgi:hypothetical protein